MCSLKEGKQEEEKKGKGWKAAFWNVAGLRNKDEEFWKELEGWDIMVMIETWVDEGRWEKIKGKLPRGYKWRMQTAIRRNKKGRAIGDMILGAREELGLEDEEGTEEGCIWGEVRLKGERWREVGVYSKGGMEERLGRWKEWMEEREGMITVIGDWNVKTGEECSEERRRKNREEEDQGIKW